MKKWSRACALGLVMVGTGVVVTPTRTHAADGTEDVRVPRDLAKDEERPLLPERPHKLVIHSERRVRDGRSLQDYTTENRSRRETESQPARESDPQRDETPDGK